MAVYKKLLINDSNYKNFYLCCEALDHNLDPPHGGYKNTISYHSPLFFCFLYYFY